MTCPSFTSAPVWCWERDGFGSWEWGGSDDGIPPLSERVTIAHSIDGYAPPPGCTKLRRVDTAPGDQYGGSTGWRTLARQDEPIRFIKAGYDSTFVWATLCSPRYPVDADVWQAGLEIHQSKASYVTVTGPAPFHCYMYANSFRSDSYGGRDGARVKNFDAGFQYGYTHGVWYVWVVRYKHGFTDGAVQVWCGKRGGSLVKVAERLGCSTMYEGTDNYALLGQYRAPTGSGLMRAYYAGDAEYASVDDALSWANVLLTV